MRKIIFVLVAFLPHPAPSQISSGTSIAINFTKDEIVIAADSRSLNDSGGPPDDSYCKIAAFRHQFIFTNVGKVRYIQSGPIDLVQGWDNTDAARDAFQNVSMGTTVDDAYMDGVVTYWATAITKDWNSMCLLNRSRCTKDNGLTALNPQITELTAGIFFAAKGLLVRGASIDFSSDTTKLLSPVEYVMASTLNQCWPCGQGEQVCAAGSHMDIAAQFCSERKASDKLSIRTSLTKADEHAKLAVEIVEKTIDAYEKSAGDVGGPVDSVTIAKDGSITWNSRKVNCPDDQE